MPWINKSCGVTRLVKFSFFVLCRPLTYAAVNYFPFRLPHPSTLKGNYAKRRKFLRWGRRNVKKGKKYYTPNADTRSTAFNTRGVNLSAETFCFPADPFKILRPKFLVPCLRHRRFGSDCRVTVGHLRNMLMRTSQEKCLPFLLPFPLCIAISLVR